MKAAGVPDTNPDLIKARNLLAMVQKRNQYMQQQQQMMKQQHQRQQSQSEQQNSQQFGESASFGQSELGLRLARYCMIAFDSHKANSPRPAPACGRSG